MMAMHFVFVSMGAGRSKAFINMHVRRCVCVSVELIQFCIDACLWHWQEVPLRTSHSLIAYARVLVCFVAYICLCDHYYGMCPGMCILRVVLCADGALRVCHHIFPISYVFNGASLGCGSNDGRTLCHFLCVVLCCVRLETLAVTHHFHVCDIKADLQSCIHSLKVSLFKKSGTISRM